VLLLCGYNIRVYQEKTIIELDLDAKVLNKDFWNGLGRKKVRKYNVDMSFI
jgi:hypothetical protein